MDPSNQTFIANNFSCIIQCSNTELVTWFVNELPLPAFESELNFEKYPKSPYCSQQHSMSNETHALSIMTLTQTFSGPLVVYCAVVTTCRKSASNCNGHTCFSENAYLEPYTYSMFPYVYYIINIIIIHIIQLMNYPLQLSLLTHQQHQSTILLAQVCCVKIT